MISGVISRVAVVITHIRELIAILITTHEPPSRAHQGLGFRVQVLGPGSLDNESNAEVLGLESLLSAVVDTAFYKKAPSRWSRSRR